MASEPIIASNNLETALVVHEEEAEKPQASSEESSSDDEAEPEYPPGAADPDRCTIGGPGANGGSAQVNRP